MPIITLKTHKLKETLDLQKIAGDISRESGFASSRLNILVEQYEKADFYNESRESPLIIHIAASESNGKETLQRLMEAVRRVLAVFLSIEEQTIAVFLHPIKQGMLLVDKNFR